MSFTQIDDLRSTRDYYYCGNFQKVIEETTHLVNQVPFALEYRLRALGEINPGAIDTEITDDSPLPLQMIKLQCLYRSADATQKSNFINVLNEWMTSTDVNTSELSQVIAALIYLEDNQLENAWKWVSNQPLSNESNLEKLSIQVHLLLLQNHSELAIPILEHMKQLDDNEVLTMLAYTWVLESKHVPALSQEALAKYIELAERGGFTEYTLNQIGLTYASLGSHKLAFQHLKRARDTAKAEGRIPSPVVLRNTLSVMYQRPGSLTITNQTVLQKIQEELLATEAQLASRTNDETYTSKYQELSDLFDSTLQNYA